MNSVDIRGTAAQVAREWKSVLSREVDRQAAALGSTLAQAARDIEQTGAHLRENGVTGGAGELAQRAAWFVERTASYLQSGHTDAFIGDLGAFTRERPWVVAASTAALGFAVARILKSSSSQPFA